MTLTIKVGLRVYDGEEKYDSSAPVHFELAARLTADQVAASLQSAVVRELEALALEYPDTGVVVSAPVAEPAATP